MTHAPITIEPKDPIVAERAEAAELRRRQLDGKERADRIVVVDLSRVDLMTLSAADEMVAKWLVVARSKVPVVAAFFTEDLVMVETLHAALKPRRQAAYVLRYSPDPARDRQPEVIGDVTPLQLETLDLVARAPEGVTARELAEDISIAATAATNRLNELVEKGLLGKGQEDRRAGTRYVHPLPTSRAAFAGAVPELVPA